METHTNLSGAAPSGIIDVDRLEKVSMGDPEYRVEILRNYLQSAEKYVAQIKRAIGDKDYETVENVSHKLKGISAHLGIKDMPDVAFQLEEQGMERRLNRS